MPFQIIKYAYFDIIISKLEVAVPEFSSVFDKDDGVYPILGEFGRFVCENIHNEAITIKTFHFINSSLNTGGYNTEDAIVIQIFELLYEKKEYIEIAQTLLIDKSLTLFNKFDARASVCLADSSGYA